MLTYSLEKLRTYQIRAHGAEKKRGEYIWWLFFLTYSWEKYNLKSGNSSWEFRSLHPAARDKAVWGKGRDSQGHHLEAFRPLFSVLCNTQLRSSDTTGHYNEGVWKVLSKFFLALLASQHLLGGCQRLGCGLDHLWLRQTRPELPDASIMHPVGRMARVTVQWWF